MPESRIIPASKNAPVKERVSATMAPVAIGAATPMRLFMQFIMLPTDAVAPRGAINPGIDQPTGAAAERPEIDSDIQRMAQDGSRVSIAPNTVSPTSMPPISTDLRTRFARYPRRISRSTHQPPTKISAAVAHSQGIVVYAAD